jgi:hypothetical protein
LICARVSFCVVCFAMLCRVFGAFTVRYVLRTARLYHNRHACAVNAWFIL